MPHLTTDDNVELYYEEVGSGTPIVFVHEFAGDYRSWEPQMRYFSRRYRCIAYNARGYPPSAVPRRDRELFAGARLPRTSAACSTNSGSTRPMSSAFPWAGSPSCISASPTRRGRVRCWSAARATVRRRASGTSSRVEAETIAARLERDGMAKFAEAYAYGPTRGAVRAQGSARFCRIQADVGRALRQRCDRHATGRPAREALAV